MKRLKLPVFSIDEFDHAEGDHDLYANTLADHLAHHHFIKVPHKHDFYLTVFFTRGTGTHEVDFTNYKVRPGSVFFLSPGQMHNWNLSADADGFVFFHTREFYDLKFQSRRISDLPFFSALYSSPVIYASLSLQKKIEPLFMSILREYRSGRLMKDAMLISLIDQLYIEFARVYDPAVKVPQAHSGYMEKFRVLESLIDKHYKEVRSPAVYAGMMNITPRHLNRICKSTVNKSVTEVITDRLMLEARRMLALPGNSIVDVANELGMFDQSYFSRVFKKVSGESPSGFAGRYSREARS